MEIVEQNHDNLHTSPKSIEILPSNVSIGVRDHIRSVGRIHWKQDHGGLRVNRKADHTNRTSEFYMRSYFGSYRLNTWAPCPFMALLFPHQIPCPDRDLQSGSRYTHPHSTGPRQSPFRQPSVPSHWVKYWLCVSVSPCQAYQSWLDQYNSMCYLIQIKRFWARECIHKISGLMEDRKYEREIANRMI